VRTPGAAHGRREPFTCDLNGQDFAKLIMAGWVPAGLALGISVGSRHDDRATARQARWTVGNAEVAGWTELVNESRHEARRRLEDDVRQFGAEGVVIAAMQLRVSQRDCPASVGRRDHIVEASLIGTAIARFSPDRSAHAEPALTRRAAHNRSISLTGAFLARMALDARSASLSALATIGPDGPPGTLQEDVGGNMISAGDLLARWGLANSVAIYNDLRAVRRVTL